MDVLLVIMYLWKAVYWLGPLVMAALYLALRRDHIARKLIFLVVGSVSGYALAHSLAVPALYGMMEVWEPSGIFPVPQMILCSLLIVCLLPAALYALEKSLVKGAIGVAALCGLGWLAGVAIVNRWW